MKNQIIYTFSFAIFLIACSTPQLSEMETAAPEEIKLSEEQISANGISWGKPEFREMSSEVLCNGKIEVPPQNLADIHTPLRGFVRSIEVIQGDHVHKGDVLLVLSHPEFARMQREFLESSKRLVQLEREYNRNKDLLKDDAVSKKDFELAETAYSIEKVHQDGLRSELLLSGFAVDRILSSGQIQESISIRSPFDGYVASLNVNTGKLVQPDDLVAQVMNNDHLHLELSVFPKEIATVQEKDRVVFKLSGSDSLHMASVYLVGKVVTENSGAVMVHAHLDRESGYVPGTFVNATIRTSTSKVLVVPVDAVVQIGDQSFVFIRTEDGFKQQRVTVLRKDRNFIEVTELDPDVDYVTSGAYYLVNSQEE